MILTSHKHTYVHTQRDMLVVGKTQAAAKCITTYKLKSITVVPPPLERPLSAYWEIVVRYAMVFIVQS